MLIVAKADITVFCTRLGILSPECICDHMVEALHRLRGIGWAPEICKRLTILAPDLFGPKHPEQTQPVMQDLSQTPV